MAAGRPSSYTEELGMQICEQIAETSDGLRKVCEDAGITPVTLFNWLNSFPEFLQRYARAKEIQAEMMADELQSIADESPTCQIPTKNGSYTATDRGGIERNKLRVDARKWVASKLLPKKYGDKLGLDVTGELSIAGAVNRIRDRVNDNQG